MQFTKEQKLSIANQISEILTNYLIEIQERKFDFLDTLDDLPENKDYYTYFISQKDGEIKYSKIDIGDIANTVMSLEEEPLLEYFSFSDEFKPFAILSVQPKRRAKLFYIARDYDEFKNEIKIANQSDIYNSLL